MSSPSLEELQSQLAAAQAEVDRLLSELEHAEWLRDYEQGGASS